MLTYNGRHLIDKRLDPSKPAPDNFWFISDPHLAHPKSITFLGRRHFVDLPHMDREIVNGWNSVVGDNDLVYVLGDFAFGDQACVLRAIQDLKGRIVLIRGNHDTDHKLEAFESRLEAVHVLHTIEILDAEAPKQRRKLILFHYPIECWEGRYSDQSWHLHGHTHATMPLQSAPGRLNLSAEWTDFKPISFNWVKERMVPLVRPQSFEAPADDPVCDALPSSPSG
jgi:calcineurin-like phosphoesterase family protein